MIQAPIRSLTAGSKVLPFVLLIAFSFLGHENGIVFGQERQRPKPQPTDPGLVLYRAAHRHYTNNDYRIEVRKEGGQWQQLVGYYAINMNKGPFPGPTLNAQTYAYFDSDFKQRIEVRVTKLRGSFFYGTNARIRPAAYGIKPTVRDNSISFFLDRPCKLSIECDEDIYHNLCLFANAVEANPPKEGDPGVRYFGPGFHEAGNMTLNSNETIYIAGGAIVRGNIRGSNISNASVKGRGVLMNGGIRLDKAENITIEGIIFIDAPGWTIVPNQVNNSVIRDVKLINKTISSDGADPSGCQNLTFDDIFFRIPDDCISVKAMSRSSDTKPNLDIMIKNCIFWSDAAHCILIGPEGNGTSTERVTITNCDFLECQFPGRDYWGVIAITNGDKMLIKDILVENCRVEDFSFSNLVAIRIEENIWTKLGPGGAIRNVVFRNVSYNGRNQNPSYIKGFDAANNVEGVVFENLTINGKKVLSAEQGRFEIGPFADNIVFK